MLEEMVRANAANFGSRQYIPGTLSPLSMSPRTGSRRASWMTPVHSSKGSMSSRAELAEALFCNAARRKLVQEFIEVLTNGESDSPATASNPPKKEDKSISGLIHGKHTQNIIEAAFAAGRWSVARFHRIVKDLREPVYRDRPAEPLGSHLDGLHWALAANAAANEGREDEFADAEVWQRFSIDIEGRSGMLPQPTDPEGVMELVTMREGAEEYFRREVEQGLRKLHGNELETILQYITQYASAPKLMELVCPLIFKRVSEEAITRDIIPRFMVLAVLQPDAIGSAILETLLADYSAFVSQDAANSALEYCAHLQRANCCRVILDNLGHLVAPEGVITALIPICARGTDHLLAVLELFIMDKCQTTMDRKEVDRRHMEEGRGNQLENDFPDIVAPCVYMFLVLAAAGGYAKPRTVKELIEFYEDPCAPLLTGRVSTARHNQFVQDLFHLVCELNLTAIVWTLIESHWIPPDITPTLRQAIELGHQSLVHILLDSLLIPDEKLEPPSGQLPLVFRKSRALTLLPTVAQRFPAEACWFLQELSSIPIPSCVPVGETREAEVRAAPVRGTRLGTATLAEVTRRTDNINPFMQIWTRLNIVAQLRGATIGTGTPEAECVICMAPEALLTEEAYHDSVGGKFFRQPSPFIRLLGTGDKEIILQPVMQALMEYHWIAGGFWYRFALHFIMSLSFIASIWAMFTLTVQEEFGHSSEGTAKGLLPITCIALFLCVLFIIQELREFMDAPGDYIRSMSNLVDTVVHISVLYCAIRGALMHKYVPPLLMGFTLVLACTRLLMQLRIIPSIGPIIRIWVSATANIFPVLVPFTVLASSFAGGFYFIQYPLALQAPATADLHFQSMTQAMQSVLTMTAGDYSVLDYSQESEVFVLRLLFHVIFIIFLVNLIIGLMTVNVANVTVNTTSAWLVEISQLMVELELYWPWPMRYQVKTHFRHRQPSSRPDSEPKYDDNPKLSNNSIWSRMRWWQKPKSSRKVTPDDFGSHKPPRILATAVDHPSEHPDRDSVLVDTPEFFSMLERGVVLYTCPEEQVAKTHWWKEGDKETDPRLAGRMPREAPIFDHMQTNDSPWNKALKIFHFGSSGKDMRIPSVPSLVGRSLSSLPPMPNPDEEGQTVDPNPLESVRFGLDMRLLDEVEEQDEAGPADDTGLSFVDVRNRRQSRLTEGAEAASRASVEGRRPAANVADPVKPPVDKPASPPPMPQHDANSIKELAEQVQGMKEALKTLERITRSETRNQRERTRRLEQTLEQERARANENAANFSRDLQNLSKEIRDLSRMLMPQPEPEGLFRRVFSGRTSSRRRNESWSADSSERPAPEP
ncbi:uncharacterized protein SPPG_05596, partial [Spizellomyces punctatus DAOM BR117]